MIVEELYDALKEAGASEEKAKAAARAVANMENHFGNIEKELSRLDQKISELRSYVDQRFTELRSYVDQTFTDIRGTQRLHSWMLGTILALLIALFFKVFSL
jgi:phage shock protein A